jgi:hypothetical protein
MQPAFAKSRIAVRPAHTALAAFLAIPALAASFSEASAVSTRVKLACASDYFAYCSQYAVGSSELRQCMRVNGNKLSTHCVNALVAEGEVSETEVNRRSASLR